MTTKTQMWGNSLAVRLPKVLTEKAGIKQGTELTLSATEESITLKPVTPKPSLSDLLAAITPENRHKPIEFGREGNELI